MCVEFYHWLSSRAVGKIWTIRKYKSVVCVCILHTFRCEIYNPQCPFFNYRCFLLLFFMRYSPLSSACLLACANNFQLNWLHRNYFWQNFSTMQFHLWRLQFRVLFFSSSSSLKTRTEWISWSIFLSFILSLKWNVILTSAITCSKKEKKKKKKLQWKIATNILSNFQFEPLASTHFCGYIKQILEQKI